MPYIGNTSPSRFVSNRAASVYSGDGSTTAFTLEQAVVQDEDILVSVDGVIQEPSVAYAVSNGTTLTFTGAPSSNSGNNIFVYYLASQVGTVGHPSNQALSATTGTFTGNTTVGGTLGVTGATTLGTKLATSNLGAGAVLQVQYFQLLTPQTESYGTTNTAMPITNFNVNITPKSTSSIIKLEANMTFEWANAAWNTMWFFYRDSTALTGTGASNRNVGISPSLINYHTDNSSTLEFATFTYFDTPSSTSQITYKVGVVSAGTDDLYINGTINQTDSVEYERGVSVFSATEIAG